MYKCSGCKGTFANSLADVAVVPVAYEFWGERGVHHERILVCPFCGDEELEEVATEESHDESAEAPSDAECSRELHT